MRTLALAALAILVATDVVAWPAVLVVAVIDRGADTLFGPASMAALPLIVADEQLEAVVGGIVGAVLAPQIGSRVSLRQSILLLTVLGALFMLVAAAVIPSPAVAVPLAIPFVLRRRPTPPSSP